MEGAQAQLTVTGVVDTVCQIQWAEDLSGTSCWYHLRHSIVKSVPSPIADSTSPSTTSRYYRAVWTPSTNLVWISPGTFTMGSPDSEDGRTAYEGPQTRVTLTQGFWMGIYEVTQQEYTDLIGTNPSHFTASPDLPVEFLSWTDATNYCHTLTQRERASGRIPGNYTYRLPTEAEWEYACRAGTTTRFTHGDDPGYASLTNYAWFGDNSGSKTHPVGEKLANPWGLYDMYGNVWEWCQDWLAFYPGGSVTNPVVAPPVGSLPTARGGGYYYDGSTCRSAERGAMDPPTATRWDVGFRVVLSSG